MVTKKPKIVIIGAGMAGLTAAKTLHISGGISGRIFDITVVEGDKRIGGRIHTSEIGGTIVETGATWIHGIIGSPVHEIVRRIGALDSDKPYEGMGQSPEPAYIAEGGFRLHPSVSGPVLDHFRRLTEFSEGKGANPEFRGFVSLSLGSFLRLGFKGYFGKFGETEGIGNWRREALEDSIFAIGENEQRAHTSADDLNDLNYSTESEYVMFPGEEITIARGYTSVIESLASVLPHGMIQLGRVVTRIQWISEANDDSTRNNTNADFTSPVWIHFLDGSVISADHVIVTVSLGVLKENRGFFNPQLPSFKAGAISRLGFGVVNKLFVETCMKNKDKSGFPYANLVFHRPASELGDQKIPWWIRKTASLCPIHEGSNVLIGWFAGKEALELERLRDNEIVEGISATLSNFLPDWKRRYEFVNVLRSGWGTDPLFLGSYSYVAVGSSCDDLDLLAEPLPRGEKGGPRLQIMFAGEATHRTHYSTTHGAYYSGIREANRLLNHYN